MGSLGQLLLVVAVAVASLLFERFMRRPRDRIYDVIARRTGLVQGPRPAVLTGSPEGFYLTVREAGTRITVDGRGIREVRNAKNTTRITVDSRGRQEGAIPPTLSLKKEGPPGLVGPLQGNDLTVGDPAFDAVVHLSGRPKVVMAVLNK